MRKLGLLPKHGLDATEHIVSADHVAASKVGSRVLAQGGNAVDAAVAVSLALAVVRPESTGLLGGGFMMIKPAGSKAEILDYRETAPKRADARDYIDQNGRPISGKTAYGPWAAGVPGQLRGLETALARHGTKSLSELVRPAITLAKDGVRVDKQTHHSMVELAKTTQGDERFSEVRHLFLKDGRPYQIGETLKQPELARTLERIAENGADELYRGETGRQIAAAAAKEGAPLSIEDLAHYRPIVRKPLEARVLGRRVLSMPPPSSGGAIVLLVLGTLERVAATVPDRAHAFIESLTHGMALRAARLGDADRDPAIMKFVRKMISPSFAEDVASRIDPDQNLGDPSRYADTDETLVADHGTTHHNTIDKDGNAVAATESINTSFGSLYAVPGTGLILNNQIDDFTVAPGVPNEFGLKTSKRNLLRPGARPLSSMSPTMVLDDEGEVLLAAGASGGPRIISSVLQTVLRILLDGLSPARALSRGRLHAQWSPFIVRYEEDRSEDAHRLREKGHTMKPFPSHAGHAQVVVRNADGTLSGASDPRKGGRPAGR